MWWNSTKEDWEKNCVYCGWYKCLCDTEYMKKLTMNRKKYEIREKNKIQIERKKNGTDS